MLVQSCFGEGKQILSSKGWVVSFAVGDKVVYPHHGAAVIERCEKVVAFGETREYFVLHISHGELTLKVPTDQVDLVGLRSIIDRDEVSDVIDVLRQPGGREPSTWSRRFKNNLEKLKSGDIYQVAELVRNLSRREQEKHLSVAEKRLLANSRRLLLSELRLVSDSTEDEANTMLDEIFDAPPS
jgi:CarD family transcriptional regulator